MKKRRKILALRDRDFFLSLSEEERARIMNPAGAIDIRDEDLKETAIGACYTPACGVPSVSCWATGGNCCCL